MNRISSVRGAIGLIIASAVVLTGCTTAPSGPEITAPATTLRVNWGNAPSNWAPGSSADVGSLRVPYENLVVLDADYNVLPNLVESWVEEPMALTLELREDVVFHDGTPFNAEAVKVNLEFVRDTPGQWSGPLQAVASVDVLDEFTAKVNFAFPSPTFLKMLTQRNVFIASPTAITEGTVTEHPVGTGPWAFDAEASGAGNVWVFNRTDDYWGELPAYETIELYAIEDDTAAVAALLNGEIDLTDVQANQRPRLDEDFVDTLDFAAGRNNIVFFDRGPGGAFADANVRKAVCTAINAEGLLTLDNVGLLEVSNQHFLEGDEGYNPDIVGYGQGDLEAAQELLGDATVDAVMPSTLFVQQAVSYLADQMNQLEGVEVEIQDLPIPEYISSWAGGNYSMGQGAHNQITPYDWYATWFSERAFYNPSGYESPELKAAAGAAIAAGSSPEADALWQEVMRVIIDEEALACSHGVFGQTLGWNVTRVSGVAAPPQPYEVNLVNYRDLTPVGN